MPEPEVTREDLKRVETRVEFVAQEVEGEKLLSRYILQQARKNGDDLAIVKSSKDFIQLLFYFMNLAIVKSPMERVEEKAGKLEHKVEKLEQKFDRLEVRLPGMIAEVMREALRENRG